MGKYFLILFGVSLLLSFCGFYKFVYFMYVGYGLAIAGNAVAILITAMAENWTRHYMLIPVLMCLLFVAYGFRLSFFLLKRELRMLHSVKLM